MRYAFQESGTSKYAQLTLVTHKRDSLEKLFYIPDNKHKRLLAILQKEAGVKKERIGTLLPLNLTKKQLQSFTNSTYSENNKTINYLTLNGQNVIGKAPR